MNIIESAKIMQTYLELERFPVGVKIFFDKTGYDSCNIEERSNKITYCNAVQLASRGKKIKVRKDHQACPNGSFALNFTDQPDPIKTGKGRFKKGIYESLEISKSVSDDMVFLKKRPYGLLLMPLKYFVDEPDVVIVIGSSYPIMRLIQANAYKNGYTDNLKTVGLQAVCHDLTTYPYETGDINISFLCPGTRLVADWKYNEMGLAIPFNKFYDLIEGLIKTTNPFERDRSKKKIIKKIKENNLKEDEIRLGENYDDGSYSGGKIG